MGIRRKPCPKCKTLYLKRIYDRLSPLEGGAWRPIGAYCPKCHHIEFLVNGKLMQLDEKKENVIMEYHDFLKDIWASLKKYKGTPEWAELKKIYDELDIVNEKISSARDKMLNQAPARQERDQLILRYMKFKEELQK